MNFSRPLAQIDGLPESDWGFWINFDPRNAFQYEPAHGDPRSEPNRTD